MTTDEHNALFDTWLTEHAAVLHHVANGFADHADRADLMQELLLAVWKAVPAFRRSARPSTFIYRVAHNAALTWKRTQRHYRQRIDRFEAAVAAEMQLDLPALMDHAFDLLESGLAGFAARPRPRSGQ